MKKIFTLISMAMVAMSMNAQTDNTETYLAVDDEGNYEPSFAAIVTTGLDKDGKESNYVANNVENGNSKVTFGTTNVEVEGVSSSTPADIAAGEGENKGQDITIGATIGDNMYEYTVNSSAPILWNQGNRGDIGYYWIQGTGVPAVSTYAEEIMTDGVGTGAYRAAYVAFDPAVGGLPVTGLYYKITTKVDGALKIGIWANKGNHPTYLVDEETKQISDFLVEGYVNGQNWTADDVTAGNATEDQVGKMKWLDNAALKALHDGNANAKPYVIGAGNQPFFGNLVVDAKAGKTYYFFQGTTQIGFNGYTFVPGASKEDLTAIEAVKNVATKNANAPMYNLAGQKVENGFKGIAIQNGRKVVIK